MNVFLSYYDFLELFKDYCDYKLTEDEWSVIYDFYSETTIREPISMIQIKDCLRYYMDDLAFLFGEFETWDEYEEGKNDISC